MLAVNSLMPAMLIKLRSRLLQRQPNLREEWITLGSRQDQTERDILASGFSGRVV